mgnify:FL=1|jgi:hypothetical protein|tara:strand:- start:131 stop:400 length:270 start_codon:yes stop_codon:yes gene_type:complete
MGFIPTNKVTQQAIKAVAVTPNDAADLPTPGAGAVLYIGTGGNLKVTTVGGDTLEFKNLASGSVLAVQVKRVWASGHTGAIAADIVALY